MDTEAQKKRKQVIFIVVGFTAAMLVLFWQFGLPALRARGTRPGTQAKAPATGISQPRTTPPTTPRGAPAREQAAGASPLPDGAEPFLPSRNDPFGLGAALYLVPGAPGRLQPSSALFSPGTWGVAERAAAPDRGGAAAAPGGAVPTSGGVRPTFGLVDVKMPSLNVAERLTPPLPGISPKMTTQYASLPANAAQLLTAGAEIPAVPSPQMEGMRLSGIVRGGQPRAILEWRTPQGTLASQVVSPNQPLIWPEGGRVERLGSDYAIIKDAQGKTWRIPLR